MPTITPVDAPFGAAKETKAIPQVSKGGFQPNNNVEQVVSEQPVQEATPKVDESLTPKFAALARQEKAMRDRVRALEAREKATKDREAEIEQANAWKSKLVKDPYSVLNEAGVSYDQLTQAALSQPSPQDQIISKLQSEIEELRSLHKSTNDQIQSRDKSSYDNAIAQVRREVEGLVKDNEHYEMITLNKAHDAVVALIEEEYNTNNNILTTEEAAQQIEEYLTEQTLTLARSKKILSKLSPPPSETPGKAQASPSQTTLTNRIVQNSSKQLSPKERALLAFNGQLNK